MFLRCAASILGLIIWGNIFGLDSIIFCSSKSFVIISAFVSEIFNKSL